jgi:hypothetical protein
MQLAPAHWVTLFFSLISTAYTEGDKFFQKRFSTRTATGARFLKKRGILRDALFWVLKYHSIFIYIFYILKINKTIT